MEDPFKSHILYQSSHLKSSKRFFLLLQGTCVELYTRGPCPDGQLVVARPGNVLGCDCGPYLKQYFWPVDEKCYPHYERGPCKENEQVMCSEYSKYIVQLVEAYR